MEESCPRQQTKTSRSLSPSQECDFRAISLELYNQHWCANLHGKTPTTLPQKESDFAWNNSLSFFLIIFLCCPVLPIKTFPFEQLLKVPLYLLGGMLARFIQ